MVRRVAVCVVAVALVGCSGAGEELWGRGFVSTEVSGAGSQLALPDTGVFVDFYPDDGMVPEDWVPSVPAATR